MKTSNLNAHLETACQTWQRLQHLLERQDVEVNGTSLDIAAVVAVAQYVQSVAILIAANAKLTILIPQPWVHT